MSTILILAGPTGTAVLRLRAPRPRTASGGIPIDLSLLPIFNKGRVGFEWARVSQRWRWPCRQLILQIQQAELLTRK